MLAAFANPANLQQLLTPPARGGGRWRRSGGRSRWWRAGRRPRWCSGRRCARRRRSGWRLQVPDEARRPADAGPTSEKLAEGVWRMNGAYNALAVEFSDHIVLFEPGPQNEARALAIIARRRRRSFRTSRSASA